MTTVRQLPTPLVVLLASQFAFNVGFYLVVPFLAAHLSGDLHLAGWVVGAILGLRTVSQQGLFVWGGAAADRWGARRSIVVGCVIRIAGFLTIAVTTSVAGVITGVLLIGVAAAVFSPATESAIVAWGQHLERRGGPTLTDVVAIENICSKAGSVCGPVLGGVLLVVPFSTTCFLAAVVFGLVLAAHLTIPTTSHTASLRHPIRTSLLAVIHDRPFLTFTLIHSSYLLAYNQLYLAAPVELTRLGLPPAAITWLFVLAAVVTILGQVPVTRAARPWGRATTMRRGYLLISIGFVTVACGTPFTDRHGWGVAPLLLFVLLLHLGQMLLLPAARDVIADLSGGRHLGTYLGLSASVGGLAVLVGSTLNGHLLDLATTPTWTAPIPWLIAAIPTALSAITITPFTRHHLPPP